jgi:predicted RNA-binding protein
MCEVKVFLKNNTDEELLMEDVVLIKPSENGVYIANLFGDEKFIEGIIKEVHFLDHKVIIDKKA